MSVHFKICTALSLVAIQIWIDLSTLTDITTKKTFLLGSTLVRKDNA